MDKQVEDGGGREEVQYGRSHAYSCAEDGRDTDPVCELLAVERCDRGGQLSFFRQSFGVQGMRRVAYAGYN